MLEPVGPLSPRTYWIRRAALIAVAVVVVVVLVWLVLGRSSSPSPVAATVPTTNAPLTGELATGSSSTSPADLTSSMFPDAASVASAASAASDASAASATGSAGSAAASSAESAVGATEPTTPAVASEVPAPDTAPSDTAAQAAAEQAAAEQAAAAQVAAEQAAAAQATQAAADAAAAQAAADAARPRDGQGRLICPDSSIQLTATVGSPTYNVGQQPIVGVTVVNVGTEACVRDVSGSLQEYLAYDAAGNRVWSTNDCLPGSGTDVRLLQPGESLQYNIKWSGTTSQPGCAAERTRVPAGEYRIEARIGSLVSSQTALTFQ